MRRMWVLTFTLWLSLVGSFARPASAETDPSPADTLLADHAGRVVLVDFWASWCVPCRKSFPWIAGVEAQFRERGFDVIAVNVDRDRAAADAFLEKNPVHARIVYDPEGTLAAFYGLERMPSSFLYDREGTLRERHIGFSKETAAALESSIESLLTRTEEPAP